MNWINIETRTIDSPEFIGSEPIERGTWLCLLRYCAGQENGGLIKGCRDWGDRKWQQLVRVTKDEAERKCELWTWEGDDLVLWGYPAEKEYEIQHMREIGRMTSDAKREAAKANGKKGGRPSVNPTSQPNGNPTETQREEPKPNPTETHRIERKGKEENGKESTPPTPSPAPPPARASLPEVESSGRKFPDHAAICARINGMRPEWGRPSQWTGAELHALHGSLGAIHELDESDWNLIKAFMGAEVPHGTDYWQPRNRSKFVETFPAVCASAQRWAEKTGNRPSRPKQPQSPTYNPADK
jgi:hypothetical protein